MATYKQPTKVASAEAGMTTMKKALMDAQVTIANLRSGEYPATKTDGIVTRGNGCATKGKTARGPMA